MADPTNEEKGQADPTRKPLDIQSILLPKKEGPSPDSAQRINAGVLFEQEQKAGASGIPDAGYGDLPAGKSPEVAAPSLGKPPPRETPEAATPKPEESFVKPLQTYQGDIESLVGDKKVSVVSIAAAEAERRAKEAGATIPASTAAPRRWPMIVAGVVLLVLAAGIIGYLFLRSTTVSPQQQAAAPFLFVDDTQSVQGSGTRSDLMQTLSEAKKNVHLSLGLVARLLVLAPDASTPQEVSAQSFLQTLAPSIPQDLLRTLAPQFLLGVHSYDENEAFVVLKVEPYETAYAGMLMWENSMYSDLLPLFARNPSVKIKGTTASTTPPVQLLQTNFSDAIVENHDARVIKNAAGDILLLWTFLNRSTVVITNNEATLREVTSRLSQAPVVSLPQQ